MSLATLRLRTSESPERELNSVFFHAPVGFAKCSGHGALSETNATFAKLLAVGEGAIPNFFELVGTAQREEAEQLLLETIAGERPSFHLEQPIFHPNGHTIWIRWTGWKASGCEDARASAYLMAEDVTLSRRAEFRVRQAEKLETVGRMAGGIAHDFNNVVTGILLYCDLLLDDVQPGTRSRQYVEEIRATSLQAAGVVRQLLAAARPQDAPPVPLLLNDSIGGMKQLLNGLLGQSRVLHLNLDANLGLVRMQPTHFQQVVLNLVLNARDATPDGGHISIETANCKVHILTESKPDDCSLPPVAPGVLPCAVLIVSDDGVGMDAETKDHVFDAFFTTKPAEKGTGLGLTMVHDIVTGNGGLVYLDSTPGYGTRVTVLLPLISEGGTLGIRQSIERNSFEGEHLVAEKELIL